MKYLIDHHPKRRSRWIYYFLGVPLTLCLFLIKPSFGDTIYGEEYEVKAGFLLYFTSFTEWPEGILEDRPDNDVFICILGRDPFGESIERVKGKVFLKNPVTIMQHHHIDTIDPCHILFISSSERDRLSHILDRVRDAPILTVSDMRGAGEAGVMINFYIERARVRLEINLDALSRGGIKLSSKLLSLARIIHDDYE